MFGPGCTMITWDRSEPTMTVLGRTLATLNRTGHGTAAGLGWPGRDQGFESLRSATVKRILTSRNATLKRDCTLLLRRASVVYALDAPAKTTSTISAWNKAVAASQLSQGRHAERRSRAVGLNGI